MSNNLGFSNITIIVYAILVIFSIFLVIFFICLENRKRKELEEKLDYQLEVSNNIEYMFNRYLKGKK